MPLDRQKAGLDRRRVLGSPPNYGDKYRVGTEPDIGHEKMARVWRGPDQHSRGLIRVVALEELTKMVHDL